MVAQAGSTDLVAGAEALRAVSLIVGALLGGLLALVGAIFSSWQAGRRDDGRMKHDRELKDMELEAVREDRLRDERRLAYTRLAAATSTIAMERDLLNNNTMRVAESMSETQLVAGSEKVKEAAFNLYRQHDKTVEMGVRLRGAVKDLDEDTDFRDSRDELEVAMFAFLDAAREELRIPPSTPLDGTPGTSTDSYP